MRTYNISLFDPSSFDSAITGLEELANEIKGRATRVRIKIAEAIVALAQVYFDKADNDVQLNGDKATPRATVSYEDDGVGMATVTASGEDAVFIEFGAGIYFNGSVGATPHSWEQEGYYPYAIGTYGRGLGAKRYWFYSGPDGQSHVTRGTPAQMPLYKATQETIPKIPQFIREEFDSW